MTTPGVVLIPGLWGTAAEFRVHTRIERRMQAVTRTQVVEPIRYRGTHVLPDFERAVADMRGRLRDPPYVLCGHSLGALYARLYARERPDDVCGLVLVESPGEPAELAHVLDHVAHPDMATLRDELRALGDLGTSGHPHALFENVSPTRAETLRYFDVFGVPATPASFVALYATLLRRHVHFVDVVARCPDSSLHTYAGKSHNLHHDVEDDLVHTLTAMVARA